jgi:hypothetical protein
VYVSNHGLGPWEIAGECDDVGGVGAEGFGAAWSPKGRVQCMASDVGMPLGSPRVSGRSNLRTSPEEMSNVRQRKARYREIRGKTPLHIPCLPFPHVPNH